MKSVVFQEGNFFHKMSWRRILSRLALRFFHRSSPKLPRLNMILPECKQVLHFLVMSKNKMYKWCKNLWFCCERRNKKMQLYQRFDVDVVPPACNFIKNKILAHMFPFEFCELLYPITLLKMRPRNRCFLANFDNLFSFQLCWKRDFSTLVFL